MSAEKTYQKKQKKPPVRLQKPPVVAKCTVEAEQAKQTVIKFIEDAKTAKALAKQEAEIISNTVSKDSLKTNPSFLQNLVECEFWDEEFTN